MPDPNEIAAAADRLRRYRDGEPAHLIWSTLESDWKIADERMRQDTDTLADAYLDEHAKTKTIRQLKPRKIELDDDEIAAAERVRLIRAGEPLENFYDDPPWDAAEDVEAWREFRLREDHRILVDYALAQLAEHADEPVTREWLVGVLGEPDWENDGRARWFGGSRGMDLLWIGDALEFTQVAFLKAKTIGMYRRILSVIREQEADRD